MGRRPAGDSSRNAKTVDIMSRNDQNQVISCNQFVVTNSRLSEITVLGELDQPSNVTEYLCAGFSCVPLGHVEALLQYKIDPISEYVCFLEFSSVSFVIVRRVGSRNMEILVLMFKAIPASGRGQISLIILTIHLLTVHRNVTQ